MQRRSRLDAFLEEHDLAAVWFARHTNFPWLTRGNNIVDRTSSVGVAAAGYDGDALTILTNNIEAERLRVEELDTDATVKTFAWHESSLSEAVVTTSSQPAAADFDVPGFDRIDASQLRQPLTSEDVATYRSLGSDVAAVVETVCRDVDPADTEREIAAALRAALLDRAIESPVVLVGGANRAPQYRHYTPSDEPVGTYMLASVTAERDGLHASCTRSVAFDPPAWLAEHHEAAMQVEATALVATRRVGRESGSAGDVFDAVRAAYEALGWPDEWRNHHQGGAAGYAGREWIATPNHPAPVHLPMGYAWNPTVQGAKSEDTALITHDTIEILTQTGEWPTREVSAVDADATVTRHQLLQR